MCDEPRSCTRAGPPQRRTGGFEEPAGASSSSSPPQSRPPTSAPPSTAEAAEVAERRGSASTGRKVAAVTGAPGLPPRGCGWRGGAAVAAAAAAAAAAPGTSGGKLWASGPRPLPVLPPLPLPLSSLLRLQLIPGPGVPPAKTRRRGALSMLSTLSLRPASRPHTCSGCGRGSGRGAGDAGARLARGGSAGGAGAGARPVRLATGSGKGGGRGWQPRSRSSGERGTRPPRAAVACGEKRRQRACDWRRKYKMAPPHVLQRTAACTGGRRRHLERGRPCRRPAMPAR